MSLSFGERQNVRLFGNANKIRKMRHPAVIGVKGYTLIASKHDQRAWFPGNPESPYPPSRARRTNTRAAPAETSANPSETSTMPSPNRRIPAMPSASADGKFRSRRGVSLIALQGLHGSLLPRRLPEASRHGKMLTILISF